MEGEEKEVPAASAEVEEPKEPDLAAPDDLSADRYASRTVVRTFRPHPEEKVEKLPAETVETGPAVRSTPPKLSKKNKEPERAPGVPMQTWMENASRMSVMELALDIRKEHGQIRATDQDVVRGLVTSLKDREPTTKVGVLAYRCGADHPTAGRFIVLGGER